MLAATAALSVETLAEPAPAASAAPEAQAV